jgi:hypothetical protein
LIFLESQARLFFPSLERPGVPVVLFFLYSQIPLFFHSPERPGVPKFSLNFFDLLYLNAGAPVSFIVPVLSCLRKKSEVRTLHEPVFPGLQKKGGRRQNFQRTRKTAKMCHWNTIDHSYKCPSQLPQPTGAFLRRSGRQEILAFILTALIFLPRFFDQAKKRERLLK